MNALGVPLGYQLGKLQESELGMGREIAKRYGERVIPKLTFDDPQAVSVFTTDSAFYARDFKQQLKCLGLASNAHDYKHHIGGQPSDAGKARNLDYLPVEAKPHQKRFANGHYELACDCGLGQVSKQAHRDHRGHAILWSKAAA